MGPRSVGGKGGVMATTSFLSVYGHTNNWDIWFAPAQVTAVSCDREKSNLHIYVTGSDDPFCFDFADVDSRNKEARRFMRALSGDPAAIRKAEGE